MQDIAQIEVSSLPVIASKRVGDAAKQLEQVSPNGLLHPQLKAQAVASLNRYGDLLHAVASGNVNNADQLNNALNSALADAKSNMAQLVSDAETKAKADAQEEQDAGAALSLKKEKTATTFGDCVITIPQIAYIRQIVVDVKITHPSPCDDPHSPEYQTPPWCPPASSNHSKQGHNLDAGTGGNSSAAPDPGNSNEIKIDPRTTNTLVYLTISHGKYYYDVGFITAVVPGGQRTISAPQRAGVPGDTAITVTKQSAVVTGFALNLYPGGHRRDAYSGFEPNFWRPTWGDMLGLQLAISPDLKTPLSTLFGGFVFEPVTGAALSTGFILLKGDFLQSGYYEGMSTSAPSSDYVVQKYMLRGYVGVTFGVRLF